MRPQRSITCAPGQGPAPGRPAPSSRAAVKSSGRMSQATAHGSCNGDLRHPAGATAEPLPVCHTPPSGTARPSARQAAMRAGVISAWAVSSSVANTTRRPACQQDCQRLRIAPGVELGGGRDVALGPGAAHQHDLRDLRASAGSVVSARARLVAGPIPISVTGSAELAQNAPNHVRRQAVRPRPPGGRTTPPRPFSP